jgi:eukaryotic-like serine/threonine-protein kinase
VIGSPTTELGRRHNETQHKMRISRSFAIAAKPVTLEEFRQFRPEYVVTHYVPTPDCPVIGTSWYMAAAYCNWLSKQEEIPEDQWCYEIVDNMTRLRGAYLSLGGYRLPTEAEMEYATRAGAWTSRYFGETEDLLPKYAWYRNNSQEQTWPVGSLKPNDLGLFDVQGNTYTWCQEGIQEYVAGNDGEVTEDLEDMILEVSHTRYRQKRGGSFRDPIAFVRSAIRIHDEPVERGNIGFRLARTLPPVPLTALPLPSEGGQE